MTHSTQATTSFPNSQTATKGLPLETKAQPKSDKVKNEDQDDMKIRYCGRYINDEVLPDENDNCSLCGSKLNHFGECLYSECSCPFEVYKGITIYKDTPRNYFYTAPIWPDCLFWHETLEGLKIKIDNLK